jgi:fused signal recognition particle receptor
MVFWRKKKNAKAQEREEADDKLLHHPEEPALEPPTEYESELSEDQKHELLEETGREILDDVVETPLPEITEPEATQEPEAAEKAGWLGRLTQGLSKSSSKLGQGIADLVTKRKLDQEMLDDLEDVLIMADLGPKTAARLVADFGKGRFGKDISDQEVKEALAGQIEEILRPVEQEMRFSHEDTSIKTPFVTLVAGVNGAGKTTTIGKMAYEQHLQEKRKVMIAAGDTFRAAAIEQLAVWAERASVPIVKKDIGADAAAVAYEAYEQAKADGIELLLIDTAGRLHNKSNLMAELEKIVRVLKKNEESLPHAVLLVLDATTGQNAIEQVRIFKEMLNVTGLIVTKLDGSAKGGIVVSLADQFGLPIHYVGVGESIEDLQPFRASAFARSLVGLET